MAQIPITMPATAVADNSPLSKRRKFTPPQPCFIPSETNADIENHVFGSPVLAQLSVQAPTQAEIEASLLQVGMRVRKSVSEGYHSPQKKPFTPHPFSNRLARLSPETQKALLARNDDKPEPELFSAGGLHKIGGMAMQPIATATFCGINLAALSYYSDDCTNNIAQQSLWTYTTSHKRTCEVDSDSDESQDWQPDTPTLHPDAGSMEPMDYFNIGMNEMHNVAMLQTGNRLQNARGRKVAKPKSRVRSNFMDMSDMPMPPSTFNPFEQIQLQPEPQSYGFVPEKTHCHRRMMSCGMEASMTDFEEPSFLQRREDVDMDCS
ncbi:uncharacterized protein HMPREF1541_00946 [Cyphellophora europaea CBS 101466]|uniref:Uncharacterized protein n=1 Tax=Cyphellophora europaea (strain CBS 101466) TaxID=1220924 RepID=W2SDI4_CYPE1|nr:uncharacterized protein HMPREF1541_00946 [Cyphellophora europaea CBS 101466]ETN46757.1 hypothetical protein HMPREF1541_00946 [Cyphellophora europaea CBS 101466]